MSSIATSDIILTPHHLAAQRMERRSRPHVAMIADLKELFVKNNFAACISTALGFVHELERDAHPLHMASLYFYAAMASDAAARSMAYRSIHVLDQLDNAASLYSKALETLEAVPTWPSSAPLTLAASRHTYPSHRPAAALTLSPSEPSRTTAKKLWSPASPTRGTFMASMISIPEVLAEPLPPFPLLSPISVTPSATSSSIAAAAVVAARPDSPTMGVPASPPLASAEQHDKRHTTPKRRQRYPVSSALPIIASLPTRSSDKNKSAVAITNNNNNNSNNNTFARNSVPLGINDVFAVQSPPTSAIQQQQQAGTLRKREEDPRFEHLNREIVVFAKMVRRHLLRVERFKESLVDRRLRAAGL